MSRQNYTRDPQTKEEFLNSTPIPIHELELESVEVDWFGESSLADMIYEVSEALETPIELAATLGIAGISAAITQKFSVLVEPSYFEPCNFWGICALEPSARKSAVLKLMADPIRDWEKNQREIWQPKIKKARSERKTIEDVIKVKRKNIVKIDDPNKLDAAKSELTRLECELPIIPFAPKLLFDDCTPEKLGIELFEQQERKAYMESEADALFSMMLGRYSDDPKLDIYLKAYVGEPAEVQRVGREAVYLSRPLLTLGICPQPSVIKKLSKKQVLVDRGLLARFFYFVPKSPVGERKLIPKCVSRSVRIRYSNRMKALLNLEIPKSPKSIILSEDAYQIWKNWQREVELMLRPYEILGQDSLKHWGGKLAGNTIRIAAVLFLAQEVDCFNALKIDGHTMNDSVRIARASISHAINVHDLAGTDDSKEKARQILDFSKSKRLESSTIRFLHSKLRGRGLLGRAIDIREGCEVLAEYGWCRFAENNKRGVGRPSEEIEFHPSLFCV